MVSPRKSPSPRALVTVVACLLALAGAAAVIVAVSRHKSPPPTPRASAAGNIASPTTTTTVPIPGGLTPSSVATKPAGLGFSAPAEITVPSLGIDSTLVRLDRNADGSVQVPTSFHVAGWYEHSVSPGQVGPSVILGHVDSKSGPGIFYRIGLLQPGAKVMVKRDDGKVATYVITGVRQYPKTGFPTIDVYGDTAVPTIRLITCGGAFDSATGHYVSNIVAFGQLAPPD
jgi:hypothetical protein